MTSTTIDRRIGVYGGVAIKAPVRVATTANITLSALQTIDGVTVAQDDRVLVKNQSNPIENGIYSADTGAWSRALDFNGVRDVVQGTLVLVVSGTVNTSTVFELTTASPVIGSTSLTFIAAPIFVNAPLMVKDKATFEASTLPPGTTKIFRLSYSATVDDGGSSWALAASEPSHPGKMQAASGEWFELTEATCRPANFGGQWYPYDEATWTAAGKTAATTAIDDAIDFMAATGAPIDHPGAIYVSMATMVLTSLVTNRIGTLFVDFSLATLTLIESTPTAVSLQGAAPTLIGTLTADIRLPTNPFSSGAVDIKNVIELSSVTGLAVDDIIIITSTQNLAGGNVTSYSTQPLRVMEIDGGALTITTYDEPWNSYLVADAATVYKFDTRTKIDVAGELRLYGGGFRAQGDNDGQLGVFCIYCFENRYNRLTTFDVQHGTYAEWNSIGTFGRLIDYHGCNAPASSPTTPGSNTAYPVGCAGSYDAYFGDVMANRARHGFSNSVGTSTYGRWCGANQRVGKMRLKEMFGGGFDGHPGVGMTYCESLEIEYNPGQADTNSSQVCLSQGAGYQIGMIRVNGRAPARAVSFESYGWRVMTFDDPTDPAGTPQYVYEPTAWVGSVIIDGGVSGDVAQVNNLTNQSGLVSPQRCHLQIDHLDARGSHGLNAKGTQGEAHIVVNGGRIVAYADILHMSTYPLVLTVTGAVDNGGGLIRLTVPSTVGLADGDTAIVASVDGVPNATGTWVIDVISSTTFDLLASTWAGAFTANGTATMDIQMPNSIRINNTDLLHLGTSSAGVNVDVDAPTTGFEAGSIIMRNGTYRSRRGQNVSANNILVHLDNMVELHIDADWVTDATVLTHTIANGGLVYSTGLHGYTHTSTGAATQGTSKATTVVLDQPAGAITTHAANLAAGTAVSFTLTDAYIAASDLLGIQHVSGGTAAAYLVTAVCAAGSATVTVRNITAGDLAEAIVLRYALTKETTLSA